MTPSSTVLAGKYRLTEPIGRGGMGTVWRAEHLGFGAPVAVKLIDPKILGATGALRRFRNEARAAATLRSPHVVQVLDYGIDEASGSPFIAMELLEGESLDRRLRDRGPLSPADTTRVVTHVSRALGRAHEAGIVHRDLKPANIFLVRNDDEEIAKVLDFGTARLARSPGDLSSTDGHTQTGAVVGTPRYMSPEQITGAEIDHRSDLWAMAIIAAECLTGTAVFAARELGALVLEICTHALPVPSQRGPVPAGFDAWFAHAAHRDAEHRYQTARALAEDLQSVCAERDAIAVRGTEPAEQAATRAAPSPRRRMSPRPGSSREGASTDATAVMFPSVDQAPPPAKPPIELDLSRVSSAQAPKPAEPHAPVRWLLLGAGVGIATLVAVMGIRGRALGDAGAERASAAAPALVRGVPNETRAANEASSDAAPRALLAAPEARVDEAPRSTAAPIAPPGRSKRRRPRPRGGDNAAHALGTVLDQRQ